MGSADLCGISSCWSVSLPSESIWAYSACLPMILLYSFPGLYWLKLRHCLILNSIPAAIVFESPTAELLEGDLSSAGSQRMHRPNAATVKPSLSSSPGWPSWQAFPPPTIALYGLGPRSFCSFGLLPRLSNLCFEKFFPWIAFGRFLCFLHKNCQHDGVCPTCSSFGVGCWCSVSVVLVWYTGDCARKICGSLVCPWGLCHWWNLPEVVLDPCHRR